MFLLRYWVLLVCLLLTGPAVVAVQEPEHAGESGEAHDEESPLKLTMAEQKSAGIVTAEVERRAMAEEVTAPGEVYINTYRSAQVTPRIEAQIVKRHARLGQVVKQSQPLVTLSSVEMAKAQGHLIVATREWQRVEELGSELVSAKRYVQAQVAQQQAYAKVVAYGMTREQAEALLSESDATKATGEYDLPAPRAGTVISDDFVVGQMVSPGTLLFEITDETSLWVKAHLSPDDAARVGIGTPARVSAEGEKWLSGRVIQEYHRLDEVTRTYPMRIGIDSPKDFVHPGQYVNVAIQTSLGEPVLAVPQAAVVLIEDTPTVFKLGGDEFHPQPIKPGETRGRWVAIKNGLQEGEEIATRGTFFLKSLMLKSQLGEGHVH
jgi:membrane fusion protein, heavy metal efflux system